MIFTETDLELIRMSHLRSIKEDISRIELMSNATKTYWQIDKRKDGSALYTKSGEKFRLHSAYGTVLDAVLAIIDNDDSILKKRKDRYGRADSLFERIVRRYGHLYPSDGRHIR